MPEKEIIIHSVGRMANTMMQLLVAKSIQSKHPEYKITGYDIKEWELKGSPPAPKYRRVPKIHIQRFSMEFLSNQIATGNLDRFMLRSPCFNIDLLPSKALGNALFDNSQIKAYETTDSDIVIHIRLEDIMQPKRHALYGPLHISFYEQVIAATGKRPIFIGQLDNSRYSNALRNKFPNARFLEGGSVLYDFETLRRAKHLVLAVSTFSWMAGWLGSASSIHFPMSGIMHPSTYKLNMILSDDPKYSFYLFPKRKWGATKAEIDSLLTPFIAPKISPQHLKELCSKSAQMWAPKRKLWEQEFIQQMATREPE